MQQHLINPRCSWDKHYCAHFADKETEVQLGAVLEFVVRPFDTNHLFLVARLMKWPMGGNKNLQTFRSKKKVDCCWMVCIGTALPTQRRLHWLDVLSFSSKVNDSNFFVTKVPCWVGRTRSSGKLPIVSHRAQTELGLKQIPFSLASSTLAGLAVPTLSFSK